MILATIVQGHRVASGLNGNPKLPRRNDANAVAVLCKELGLDLSGYHLGTLNVSIAPLSYRVVKSRSDTFRALKWLPD